MITFRPGVERGHFDFGWLDTFHTFSFGDYFDPEQTQFRSLRVLNEDRVAPGQGFGTHGHRDMEILTWVLSGALAHEDSLGSKGLLRPGEAQVMSAGTGIRHSEFNGSSAEPVHFLQIWLLPERQGLAPRYDQVAFTDADLRNRLHLIAGSGAAPGRAQLFQDLQVFAARLDAGQEVQPALAPGRFGFLQVATGSLRLNGQLMNAGDSARIEREANLSVLADSPTEFLFFDLA